jgi:hypothetical protein
VRQVDAVGSSGDAEQDQPNNHLFCRANPWNEWRFLLGDHRSSFVLPIAEFCLHFDMQIVKTSGFIGPELSLKLPECHGNGPEELKISKGRKGSSSSFFHKVSFEKIDYLAPESDPRV